MTLIRRLLLSGVVAVFACILTAGAASAATNPPPPESPTAVGGTNAFASVPDPLPQAPERFDPNDLLTYYGTAGPTWHYYDLNPFEEVGASMWVELANDGLGNSKMVLSASAAFAQWVFNPGSLLDQLAGPADESASTLNNGVVSTLLPLAVLIVTAGLVWAARKGKVGKSLTRIMFVLAGLTLIGLGAASPSSYARQFSGLVSQTVATVLVPGGSTAPGNAIGTKMVGPLYKAAVYDRWQDGMFGSATSQTAQSHAAPMFQDQALTWREAVELKGQKDKIAALTDAKKKDWAQHAAQINGGDPDAYPYVQGSRASFAPVLGSYAIIAACLPFLLAAMVLILLCYVGLFLLAALAPVIGLAVIVSPRILGKVGRFALALFVNGVVYAIAAGVILKLSNGLLTNSNTLLAIILTGLLSVAAWKLLKPFRQFGEGAPAMRLNMDLERRYKQVERLYKQVEEAFRGGKYGAKKGAVEGREAGSPSAASPDGAPAQVEALPTPDTAPTVQPVEYPRAPAAPTSHVALNTLEVEAPAPAAGNGHAPTTTSEDLEPEQPQQQPHPYRYPGVTFIPTREDVLNGNYYTGHSEPPPSTARRRPVGERVIFNPDSGRDEQLPAEDSAPAEGVTA